VSISTRDAAGPDQRKPAAAAVREFFGSSQLSQFMDQTIRCRNHPTSAVIGVGPGGLPASVPASRCATCIRPLRPDLPRSRPRKPEHRPLINSLATVLRRVNKYASSKHPTARSRTAASPRGGYLSAMEEGRYHVAQANVALDTKGRFTDDSWSAAFRRRADDHPDKVDYMTCRRSSWFSVAAALISVPGERRRQPGADGLEHAASGRALVRAEAPFVGTGMEGVVAP